MQADRIEKIQKYKYVILTILVLIVAVIIDPHFMNPFNIEALLLDIAIIGIMSIGQAMVIFLGCIDLSVGNIASLATVNMAWMMLKLGNIVTGPLNILLCIIYTLIFSAVLGLITGISVAKFKLPPIIASLGTMWIAWGFSFYFLRGMSTIYPETAIINIARTTIGPVPVVFLFFLLLAFIAWLGLTKTPQGRSVFAVGGNEYASYISGINTLKTKIIVFLISGVLSAIAGIILGSYQGTSYPKAAKGYELLAIAGVVMGGTSLSGGVGNIWNCVLGLIIFRVINKIMIFANLSGYLEGTYVGIILIVVLAFSNRKVIKSKITKKEITVTEKVGG